MFPYGVVSFSIPCLLNICLFLQLARAWLAGSFALLLSLHLFVLPWLSKQMFAYLPTYTPSSSSPQTELRDWTASCGFALATLLLFLGNCSVLNYSFCVIGNVFPLPSTLFFDLCSLSLSLSSNTPIHCTQHQPGIICHLIGPSALFLSFANGPLGSTSRAKLP